VVDSDLTVVVIRKKYRKWVSEGMKKPRHLPLPFLPFLLLLYKTF
jgi:hypothetical protein